MRYPEVTPLQMLQAVGAAQDKGRPYANVANVITLTNIGLWNVAYVVTMPV